MDAMEISKSGMDVEWRRLEVIAQNLANMNTTRTALGEPYRPQRLVSGPAQTFSQTLQSRAASHALGVAVYGVEPMNVSPRRVYDPTHPHADQDGFVNYPAIDHTAEMTSLVETSRTYEANVVALNFARQMYSKATEIGKK